MFGCLRLFHFIASTRFFMLHSQYYVFCFCFIAIIVLCFFSFRCLRFIALLFFFASWRLYWFLLYRVFCFCSSLHSVIVARFIALLFFASWRCCSSLYRVFLFSFCFIQFFAPRFIALFFVLCCFVPCYKLVFCYCLMILIFCFFVVSYKFHHRCR